MHAGGKYGTHKLHSEATFKLSRYGHNRYRAHILRTDRDVEYSGIVDRINPLAKCIAQMSNGGQMFMKSAFQRGLFSDI